MKYLEFKNKLLSYGYGTKCLEFLADRIGSDNYRGLAPSQHNRYKLSDVLIIIEEIYNIKKTEKLKIRTQDCSTRPYNTEDEKDYAICVLNIHKRCGKYTQDSLRKNLFVDMERMEFLHRYKEGNTYYAVSLTPKALELLKYKDKPFQRDLIYVEALNSLLKNAIDVISHYIVVSDEKKKEMHIDIFHFMYFLSFSGFELNGHTYTTDELIEYIEEFNCFPIKTREAIKDFVSEYCNAQQKGDKTDKRDLHNWKNEAQQVFHLLGQTPLFAETKGKSMHYLTLRTEKGAIFEDVKKLKRSEQQKNEYYKRHNVSKKIGFELHHIIPLHCAKTPNEYHSLDVWENMAYIDGETHAILKQTGEKNRSLLFSNEDMILKDVSDKLEQLYLKYHDQIEYDPANQSIMQNFNNGIPISA